MALITFLVEDNKTIRDNLVPALEDLVNGRVVGYAETETDALAWLAEHPDGWQLLIVDLFLKDGTGFRVLEACRDRSPSQKIVVLSNYATPEMRRKCVHLGADAVFDKATEIDDLIDYCLSRRQAQFSSPAAH